MNGNRDRNRHNDNDDKDINLLVLCLCVSISFSAGIGFFPLMFYTKKIVDFYAGLFSLIAIGWIIGYLTYREIRTKK